MSETTARLRLPFIAPGQAQKELWHNEALALIDGALAASAEEPPLADPPMNPAEGQSWIIGIGGTGAWAGKDNHLATWTAAGWRFVAPVPGMMAWIASEGFWIHWNGAAWSGGELPAAAIHIGGLQVVGPRRPAIASPSGGTIIDAEGRIAIDAIIAALMSHGLID